MTPTELPTASSEVDRRGLNLASFSSADFDRGGPRWKEALWVLCRILFFINPVPLPSRFRVFLLRAFGAQVGLGVVIRSGVRITFPWRLRLGSHVWLGEEASILNLAEVTIGSNCCVSQRVFLCTGSHEFSSPTFDLVTNPIVVGDGCWIAASSFVAPGVTFHPHSMCAAGSVVVKDVEGGTVVGGNPAKEIKRLVASC